MITCSFISFLVYVKILSVSEVIQHWKLRWWVGDELERIQKKAILASYTILSQELLEWLKWNM